MRWDIFTLFPGMLTGPFSESIIKRAAARGLVEIALHDWREQATDRHHTVDDTPYGGGAGMVLQAPPLVAALEAVLGTERAEMPVILLSPGGRRFSQAIAEELAQQPRVALLCGHYEGFDERVRELVNGELAAAVIVDATTRLLPGVIAAESLAEESHTSGILEGPHFTRPLDFRGRTVPPILLTGHHANIDRWRRREALRRTLRQRPDLLTNAALDADDQRWLAELRAEQHAEQAEAVPDSAP